MNGTASSSPERPRASSPVVERRMKQQARRDTKPELALRRELFRRGLRYRVDRRLIGRRRADIVFVTARVVVFVDGCFWHTCPLHATIPKANRDWWVAKLAGNVARDRATDIELLDAGWTVVRVWEHEEPAVAAERIEALVRGSAEVLDAGRPLRKQRP